MIDQKKWTSQFETYMLNVDAFQIEGCFRNRKGMIDLAFSMPIGDVPILVAKCMAISM